MAGPEQQAPPAEDTLAALRKLDTPTVCNALEALDVRYRTSGFSTRPFVCAEPSLPPIVGFARTARIAAREKPAGTPEEIRAHRLAYYRMIEDGPRPSVVVLEDIDPEPGYGAFWGEVNSAIHKGLGCLGVVTNGSIRDLDDIAPGFQLLAGLVGPSHAWVSVREIAVPVTVHGLRVEPGDLIHADRHGAAVIPPGMAQAVLDAADTIARKEALILDAARAPGFTTDKLVAACRGAGDDVH